MTQKQLESIIGSDWITQKEIRNQLFQKYKIVISKRTLQKAIKKQRERYKKKKVKAVIIKSNQGYKVTNNPIEIQRFANEMIVSGMSMMKEGLDFLRLTEKE